MRSRGDKIEIKYFVFKCMEITNESDISDELWGFMKNTSTTNTQNVTN